MSDIDNEHIHCDHVTYQTPLGLASIQWRGPKGFGGYVAYVGSSYVAPCQTINEAKQAIREYLETKSCELDDFLLDEIK